MKKSLMLFFIVTWSFAQTKINLQTALALALKNNSAIKNERLKAEYQKQLIKTATNMAPISISAEYGQINSFYNDTKFGVSQTLNFPAVYSSQKKIFSEEWKSSLLKVALQETELKKAVYQSFYSMLYLNEKEKLLQKSDTLFSEFLKKSELRFKKGESNVLEKITAENQRGAIQNQILQLQQEKELSQLQLQLLLNEDSFFELEKTNLKLNFSPTTDSILVQNHPYLQVLEQQKKIAKANTKLEKNKLLPSFTIGYVNNSFIGNGANNVLYDHSNRFHSAQIGLGIPLFGGAQKAKIVAAALTENSVENDFINQKKSLQNQFKSLFFRFQSNEKKIEYLEKTALPNSKIIGETANKQFFNGDINYLDWTLLINQSIAIKSNYIEAIANQNETIIQLNYLTLKL
jgi:heavy metal efflux system protein